MSTPREREQAEKLFEDLRSGLVNAEALIIKIIQTKAWVHLGYTSFVEAWNDRMQGVRLASEALRAHVVYALLSDGLSDYEIGYATGVPDGQVGKLREVKQQGTPAEVAYGATRVRAHTRGPKSGQRMLHLDLGVESVTRYKAIAKRLGLDVEKEAERVVSEHFERLECVIKTAARA